MKIMNRKNSKYVLSSIFVGIFASSALLGVFKGIDFSNEANIYIHGQKTQIEDIYNEANLNDIALFEDEIDTGEGGEEGDGGEVTPPTSSVKESQAKWAQIGFMTAALSGTYDYREKPEDKVPEIVYDDTILYSNDQDWNQTDINKLIYDTDPKDITEQQQRYNKVYNYASGIKFYTETIGNTTGPVYIYEYIGELVASEKTEEMNAIYDQMNKYAQNTTDGKVNGHIKGFADLYDIWQSGEEEKAIIIEDTNVIKNTENYRMEVTSFLYTYSYLWQDSNSTIYDYKLTEELIALRPSFVWQQDVELGTIEGAVNPDAFNEAVEGTLEDDDLATAQNAGWNDWSDENGETPLEGDWAITYDDYTKLPYGLVGYRGIQTQNNSALGSVDSQFWNYKDEFYYDNDETVIKKDSQLVAAQNGDAMLYNQFNESDAEGTYLVGGTEEGGGNSTLAHSIITPYVFTTNYNENTGLANKWEYSLYGSIDSDNVVTNINDEEKESIETSIFTNYTQLIVGEKTNTLANGDEAEKEKREKQEYALTALYIIYSIYNAENSGDETTSSNPLLNNAYKYWNDQGFYIELTGSYYDDYSDLLPKLIQKDYGQE